MTATAQLRSWAQALGGDVSGRGVICPGPGHSTRDRSLSVTPSAGAPDGFLVHSFSGDDPIVCKDYIRTKLGQPEFKPNGHSEPAKKTYFDYHAESGAVVYQVERTDYYDGRKKTFRQRRPDGNGGWLWNLGGVRLVPYRLPELIEAAGNGNLIVIAEGERKVDLLRTWNIAATCNSGGRGSVKNWAAHARDYFKPGDKVVLLPDNDKPGQDHANAAGAFLKTVDADVRILDLPGLGPKGDVVDWAAAGGTREQLHALIDAAAPWQDARAQKAPEIARVTDAATFMRTYVPISYTFDGVLPSGFMYGLTGRRGDGKTAWAIAGTLAVVAGDETILGYIVRRGRVAYIVMENPVDFKMKLAANCYLHNLSYDDVAPMIAIIDGGEPPEAIIEGLRLDAEKNGPFQLVNYDTFQAGFAMSGHGDFNDNAEVLKFLRRLRPFTELPGQPSTLVLMHPTKNAGEDDLVPYGGGAIINELDGNLTVWSAAPYRIKFWRNKVRGPEFEPRHFQIDKLSCPDIVDIDGRQILLPALRTTTELDVEERAMAESENDMALLRALIADPKASQSELARAIGLSKSAIGPKLKKLLQAKMITFELGTYAVAERVKKRLNAMAKDKA